MKIKSSRRKAIAAALFEKRLVIQKLIDRAEAKKMNLNGQNNHFYRLHAVLAATVKRLYNDLRRLENLERKRLYSNGKATTAVATTKKLASHSLQRDSRLDSSLMSSSSSASSSSSSSSSSEDEDEIHLKPTQTDFDSGMDEFFQRLKTARLSV